ncbi:unnamed protein product [Brassicogethes aeneus]|uniref:Ubiquitin-conjugating enzyme E2 T n=1 Tax=Brassicogethes aeneus TaxID=1431903 RepID=A0A9P0AXP9_BRAAE|nr:unnamed protein product [Brassicogethes aeneus]
MQKQRLAKELAKITSFPPTGICLYYKDESTNVLEAKVEGPPNSSYSGGIFTLEINIPERYPFVPPLIKFMTKIYHPNIDDNGRICLDLLKMPPAGNWKPTIGIEGLLIAVRMLIECPNPDDPLMADIAEEYKNYIDEFKNKAKKYTLKYAIQ